MWNELTSELSYEGRLWHHSRLRLLSKPTILLALRFFWVIVVIWCEFGVFFYSLSDCRWPDKDFKPVSRHNQHLDEWLSLNPPSKARSLLGSPPGVKPTRVLLIADVRLRNPTTISAPFSWFTHDPELAYLRKGWRVASRLRPNVVMFLGDTFASSRHITSEAE